ncbi:hypothetical protein BpHYR1_048210 [Brachionus plicatilis]|uniref:Uncharacterized protein n=1 Tax=Brachionus plicatilis TaxID=10195 RepID=A0A3M7QJT8_BRAPC|nr:hypothetical protein BpHYR1_048210 [Brachionus plicatilis]
MTGASVAPWYLLASHHCFFLQAAHSRHLLFPLGLKLFFPLLQIFRVHLRLFVHLQKLLFTKKKKRKKSVFLVEIENACFFLSFQVFGVVSLSLYTAFGFIC